jgi:hypothetical protein
VIAASLLLDLAAVPLIALAWLILVVPPYIIGTRRRVAQPWLSFIPFGLWIVLLRSVGTSGWFTLLLFLPTVGGLVVWLYLVFTMPSRQQRTGWWTVAFIFLPIASYWAYALTLRVENAV